MQQLSVLCLPWPVSLEQGCRWGEVGQPGEGRMGSLDFAFLTKAASWAVLLGQGTASFSVSVRKNDRAVLLERIAMWFTCAWHWAICKAFLGP